MAFTIGFDFGTSAARACILDLETGKVVSTATSSYQGGQDGIYLDPNEPLLARQSPLDYLESLEIVGKRVVDEFSANGGNINAIIGIGVDTTGSTPIPVKRDFTPLMADKVFKDNLNAYAWLWKDHTSVKEALEITELAKSNRPQYLERCGGTYSSEWFWSKVYRCAKVDADVFENAYTWVEQSDFIPGVLAGINDADRLKRNICAAGHKAMYSDDWGGLPDKEFLGKLDPNIALLRDRLYTKAYTYEESVGNLCDDWAIKMGLPSGIPIAVGALDAHVGAIGAGVSEGRLVKILGTSSCDIMVYPKNRDTLPKIDGVAGIVDGSVLPGYIGIEAGQAAVGDLMNWWVKNVLNKEANYHQVLTEKASTIQAGESGLLALDWNNGNRNILGDQELSGLVLGQTLSTKDFEIYRALIEATAFGALKIIEQIENSGVTINELIVTGGIGHKNKLFLQIYADVIGRTVKLVEEPETVAVGAAVMGAVALSNGNSDVSKLVASPAQVFSPNVETNNTYQELYQVYSSLHNAFGKEDSNTNLYPIMKKLMAIKEEVKKRK